MTPEQFHETAPRFGLHPVGIGESNYYRAWDWNSTFDNTACLHGDTVTLRNGEPLCRQQFGETVKPLAELTVADFEDRFGKSKMKLQINEVTA